MSEKHPQRVLVVEDGASEREALARLLRLEKFEVVMARDPADALTHIDEWFDLVVSDLRMGPRSGIDLLRAWRDHHPHTPFVILTAFGAVDSAVRAMKLGASDFLAKPVDPEHLLKTIRELLAQASSEAAPPATKIVNDGIGMERIIGRSAVMNEVAEQTIRAARTSSTVLLLGESGTGKELFAEAIHHNSPRHRGPFVVVNMAAIPETLVESELFGHVRGSFTGATADRTGRFEQAHCGTLFIDEIGDFPLHLQPKLLRALESRAITPIGSTQERRIDVRVVAATSRPIVQMKIDGQFREDLYYRLNVISIQLPPLRERRQDIPLIVRHFLTEMGRGTQHPPLHVAPELMRALEGYDWPGNVRELRNCLERMAAMARGETLTLADLPPEIRSLGESIELTTSSSSRLEAVKRQAMLQALEQFGGNRTRAAEFLGISVRTLQRKLRDGEIPDPKDSRAGG